MRHLVNCLVESSVTYLVSLLLHHRSHVGSVFRINATITRYQRNSTRKRIKLSVIEHTSSLAGWRVVALRAVQCVCGLIYRNIRWLLIISDGGRPCSQSVRVIEFVVVVNWWLRSRRHVTHGASLNTTAHLAYHIIIIIIILSRYQSELVTQFTK